MEIFCVMLAVGKWLAIDIRQNNVFYARSQKELRHVNPSSLKNSATTGRIFMKIDILAFFEKSVEKIQVALKSDKNNGRFTWRPMYIYDHISLNSS
jgi:hypothetical protein